MYKTFSLVSRNTLILFLVITIIFSGFLLSGCGVKKADQEKALMIIHNAEPNFEQLAQEAIKNHSAFKETKRGSFGWKFNRKSVIDQIFAKNLCKNNFRFLVVVAERQVELVGKTPLV